MIARLAQRRPKVVDALALAAVALLGLKGAALLLAPSMPDLDADGLPRFAHALAVARSNYIAPDPATTGSVPDAPKAPAPPPAEPPVPAPAEPARASTGGGSASELAIRERLGERREQLQQRGRELEARERLIEEVERRLDAKAEEARRAEERQATAAVATDGEASALKGLVTMYETMKPKDAARVFDRLPQDVLVPVVRGIAPRKMAEIMAAMSPEGAEKLTVALARRPRDGPARSAPATLPAGELQAIDLPARPTPAARP